MVSRIPQGGGIVKLNSAGMKELLKSAEIEAELVQRMRNVQAALPESELEVKQGKNRVRVRVKKGNIYQEAATGDLSRALDLAGGKRAPKKGRK